MNLKTLAGAVAGATMAALLATPALAANVLDQNQADGAVNMANFYQGDLAQSFATALNNVSGGGVYLVSPAEAGFTVNFGLWSALPSAAGAVQIASGAGVYSGSGQWVDAFWTPVAVTAGQTYYLTFSAGSNAVAGSTANPYAAGQVYANNGYSAFPNYDYAFRTYSSSDFGSAVPEPATWAMMIIGFGAVGSMVRTSRRRNAFSAA